MNDVLRAFFSCFFFKTKTDSDPTHRNLSESELSKIICLYGCRFVWLRKFRFYTKMSSFYRH